jgi:hypothetical protein
MSSSQNDAKKPGLYQEKERYRLLRMILKTGSGGV